MAVRVSIAHGSDGRLLPATVPAAPGSIRATAVVPITAAKEQRAHRCYWLLDGRVRGPVHDAASRCRSRRNSAKVAKHDGRAARAHHAHDGRFADPHGGDGGAGPRRHPTSNATPITRPTVPLARMELISAGRLPKAASPRNGGSSQSNLPTGRREPRARCWALI